MKSRPHAAAVMLALGFLFATARPALAAEPLSPRARPHNADETTQRRVEMRLQNLAGKLELTEEQKVALRPILESESTSLRALRMNTSLAPEEQESQLLAIRDRFREQIKTILTPQQQTRLEELRTEARAKLSETDGQKRKGRIPVTPDND